MALPTEPTHQSRHQTNAIPNILHTATSNLQSIFNFNSVTKTTPSYSARVCFPLMYPDSPKPLAFESVQPDPGPNMDASNVASLSESNKGLPSSVRIGRVNANSNGSGPAFVGQVFSMCDLSGTGLMAVSTHFDIPFISKRFIFFSIVLNNLIADFLRFKYKFCILTWTLLFVHLGDL